MEIVNKSGFHIATSEAEEGITSYMTISVISDEQDSLLHDDGQNGIVYLEDQDRKAIVRYYGESAEISLIGYDEIYSKAFINNHNITSLTLPSSISSIGNNAFQGCDKLEHINLPEGLTYLGYGSFLGTSSLKEITIPASISEISASAFYESGIETLTLSEGNQIVSSEAFAYCKNLKSVDIVSTINEIGYCAFAFCPNLETVTFSSGDLIFGKEAFYYSGMADIVLPSGIKVLTYRLFSYSGLEYLYIPKSVTDIGLDVCFLSENLTTIEYEGTVEEWSQISILGGNDWIWGTQVTQIICADGVVEIG